MMASSRPLEGNDLSGIVEDLTQAVIAEVTRLHGQPSPEFRDRLARAFTRVINSEMDASVIYGATSLSKPLATSNQNSKKELR